MTTIKIYLQFGCNHLVGETLRNTYLLFFNKKKGTYRWWNLKSVVEVENGIAEWWHEVEFEKWEHIKELIDFHPDIAVKKFGANRSVFVGDKSTLRIGKTDKWTKW